MNDDARTPLNHGRQQAAIQSHGREEILVQGLLPDFVCHGDKSAARRGCPADVVHDDVNSLKAIQDFVDHFGCTFSGRVDPVLLMNLRPANKADEDAIWGIFNAVVAPGDTYILEKVRKDFASVL